MKLTKKSGLALVFIAIFMISSVVAFSGFFLTPEPRLVVLETSKGIIEIELYQDKAPVTVTNFIKYVEAKFFDGTVFHRVVKLATFSVVQGGGFTEDGTQKPTNPPIKLESTGLKNLKGTIAMARSASPDSATSQFYFNVIDHAGLDPSTSNSGYAVFGKVIQGWEIVESIAGVTTGTKTISGNVFEDWPIQDIVIQRAYVKR
jgi:cyclophilin family peptidyl-prolyl cis-trans isomerase